MFTKKHILYYIILSVILLFGLFLLLQKNLSSSMHIFIALLLCLFYVIWGIVHHRFNHSVSARIVLEYVLIGIVGFLILNFLLQIVL
jgi:hypothetical protein